MRKSLVFLSVLILTSSAFADEPKKLWTSDWLSESQRKVSADFETSEDSFSRHIDTILPSGDILLEKEFVLPIEGVDYVAKTAFVEKRSDNNMSWFGYVGRSQFLSVFERTEKLLSGYIVTDDFAGVKYYAVKAIKGKHVLQETNVEKILETVKDDHISAGQLMMLAPNFLKKVLEQNGKRRSIGVSYRDCLRGEIPFYTVDLLGIYDTTARERFGSLEELELEFRANASMLNAVLLNSKITIGKFNFLGVQPAPAEYTSNGNLWDDLIWSFRDPAVSALGQEKKADIITFMIGGTGGGGWGGGPRNVWRADGGWPIFVHENGHSIELNHQPEDQPISPLEDYPFSRAHLVWGLFRTGVALAMGCENCPVIPVYSNPSVFYQGVSTGVPNERNNALMASIKIPVYSKLQDGIPLRCSVSSLLSLAGDMEK